MGTNNEVLKKLAIKKLEQDYNYKMLEALRCARDFLNRFDDEEISGTSDVYELIERVDNLAENLGFIGEELAIACDQGIRAIHIAKADLHEIGITFGYDGVDCDVSE